METKRCHITGERVIYGWYYKPTNVYLQGDGALAKYLREEIGVDSENELSDEFIIDEAYSEGELEEYDSPNPITDSAEIFLESKGLNADIGIAVEGKSYKLKDLLVDFVNGHY